MKKILPVLFIILCVSSIHAQNLAGKIVFSHFNKATQTDTIYVMDNNGQNLTVVTTGFRPRLAHNGKYLAFSNGPLPNQSFNSNIWMRDLIAQHDTLIVPNSGDYVDYYDFSPGDTKVVYGQGCNLYTSNIDGTNSYVPVTCVPCDCFSDDPTVRLSDSLIVYHNVHYGIYTVGFDGTNPSPQIVPHTYPGDLYPIWSPDGQWFSYLKADPTITYLNNLFKIKGDGSDSTQLTFLSTSDSITADPVWASDMQSIYVIARIDGVLGLYRVSADGSGTHTLMRPWSADGSESDFWLGLADSISSNPISVQAISSPSSHFFITPNPASLETTLQISLQQSLDVTVELFDLTGRKVQTIFSGNLSKGSHSLRVDMKSLHSGNYLVRMKTPNASLQQKLIIVK
jgi:hypothetical protein